MGESIKKPVLNKQSHSSYFFNWGGKGNSFLDKMLRCLYIFLLFAINFVMFVYSINSKLMENNGLNPAIVIILGGILFISFVLILLLAFAKDLQNGLCAICTMLITCAFFYQFGQGDVDNFIENWCNEHASWLSYFCFIPSPWMVGLFLGIIVFFLFRNSLALLFVTMVILFSGVIGIQHNEFLKQPDNEYQEVKSFTTLSDQDGRDNLIYFFIPKLPSYQLFAGLKDKNLHELGDMIVGFFADNDFEVYPNAFVQKNDTMSNIIDILNQVDYTSQSSRNRGIAEFINNWNFVHGSLDVFSLERNELNTRLKENGYKVSMYAMPGFNFCMRGDDFYADRCVVKADKRVSLYDTQVSTEKNVYALLGEWIMSLKSRNFNSFAKMFINMSSLKNYKVLAENRRVSEEGSPAVFDVLLNDFRRDPDGHSYIVYIDLPSDMYIYDEYCNLKPRKDWIALKDNSIYPGGIDAKRKAYAEQTKCVIGKMQEFMEALHNNPKLKRTNIIVQGVSTIQELAEVSGDIYSNFVAGGLVTLGLRRAQASKFLINANICLASDFTKTFINFQDYCYSLDSMPKYKSEDKYILKKNLINNSIIRNGVLRNSVGKFKDWYKLYRANSVSFNQKMRRIEVENQRQKNIGVTESSDRDLKTGGAQNNENIFFPTDEPIIESVKDEALVMPNVKKEDDAKNKTEEESDISVKENTEVNAKENVKEEEKTIDKIAEINDKTEKVDTAPEVNASAIEENAENLSEVFSEAVADIEKGDKEEAPEQTKEDTKSDDADLDLFK